MTDMKRIIGVVALLAVLVAASSVAMAYNSAGADDDSAIMGEGSSTTMSAKYSDSGGYIEFKLVVPVIDIITCQVTQNGKPVGSFESFSSLETALDIKLERGIYEISIFSNQGYTATTSLEVTDYYKVSFMNGSSVLQSDWVKTGAVPIYSGSTPTKPSDPEYNYSFSGWNPGLSAISGPTTYAATFTSSPVSPPTPETSFIITAEAGEGGSISPSGKVTVSSGASQTFTFTPSKDYVISDVMVNGESKGAIPSYTFTDVKVNASISVSFRMHITNIQADGVPDKQTMLGHLNDSHGGVRYIIDVSEIDSSGNNTKVDPTLFGDMPDGKRLIFTVMDGEKFLYSIEFPKDESYSAGEAIIDIMIKGSEDASDEIKGAAGDAGASDAFYLFLSASGPLPPGTIVRYYVGDHYQPGDVVELHYFNEVSGKMESQSQTLTVGADGCVVFTIAHASVYALLEIQSSPVTPEDSDWWIYVVAAIVMILIVVAAVFVMRSRAK